MRSSRVAGTPRVVRTLFISDVHLGSRHAQSGPLLQFLQTVRAEQLFIVGDFIDGWKLKQSFRWDPEYDELLELLSDRLDSGMRVYYVSGNHDDFLRHQPLIRNLAERLGSVQVAEEFVFETADSRRFLVTHGDRFDVIETSAQWLSRLSTVPYELALSLNWCWHRLRRHRDRSPYRACAVLKDRVKCVIRFMSRFEDALMGHAHEQGCEGVICGHLHSPSIQQRNGITYCNTGDWVENCTALLENCDGSLELAYYYGPEADALQADPALSTDERGTATHTVVPAPRKTNRPRWWTDPLVEPAASAGAS